MNSVDVPSLLVPISDSAPSGENLEYAPEFAELEKTAKGTPQQEIGDTVIEAQEPDWRSVEIQTYELLGRSHDLRLCYYLAQVAIRTGGIVAFRDVLALTHGLLTQFWDTVHPQLDAEDDNDPTMRVNSLGMLCDGATIVAPLRRMPLVRSRSFGNISRREFGVVSGEISIPEEEERPDPAALDGAFQEIKLAQLTEQYQASVEAVDLVKKIDLFMTQQVGAQNAKNLTALQKELDAIRKVLTDQWKKRGGDQVQAEEPAPSGDQGVETGESDEGAASGGGAPQATRSVMSWDADITNRQDALRALDKASKYFERYEPSSPIPLFLRRAKRLFNMNFLEILADITPDGIGPAEHLGGVTKDEYLRDGGE